MEKRALLVMDVKHKVTGRHLIVRQKDIKRGMWGIPRMFPTGSLLDDVQLEDSIAKWLTDVLPGLEVKDAIRVSIPHLKEHVIVVQALVTGSFDEFNRGNLARVSGAMDLDHPEREAIDSLTRFLLPQFNGKD